MVCNEQLVARIRAVLESVRGVTERCMFGGVCFTLNGNMVCGVVKDDLMVRVGPDKYTDAIKLPHAREMDFTGRAMKAMCLWPHRESKAFHRWKPGSERA